MVAMFFGPAEGEGIEAEVHSQASSLVFYYFVCVRRRNGCSVAVVGCMMEALQYVRFTVLLSVLHQLFLFLPRFPDFLPQ